MCKRVHHGRAAKTTNWEQTTPRHAILYTLQVDGNGFDSTIMTRNHARRQTLTSSDVFMEFRIRSVSCPLSCGEPFEFVPCVKCRLMICVRKDGLQISAPFTIAASSSGSASKQLRHRTRNDPFSTTMPKLAKTPLPGFVP